MQSKVGELADTVSPEDMAGKFSTSRSKTLEHNLPRDRAWRVASNIFVSFKYAWAGITYSFNTQRNFRIHCFMGSLAITLGASLRLGGAEMAILCITSGLVLTLELINTAIESVVDLTVQKNYHELAKIAKDCAAGAVMISALASLLVAAWLILPKLLLVISG
jgi:diacylglycerol kinase (ATP)